MPHFSNPLIILVIGVCAFFLIAKLLKVEKGATILAVIVVVALLVLHFTGYGEPLYNIIFNAPPVQKGSGKPADLMLR
jgi:hypothetical protein